jgi:hypothetical protein
MKLIETTVSEKTVRLRLADKAEPAEATEWLDVQMRHQDLKLPSGTVVPRIRAQALGALEIAALDHVLRIVQREIERLRNAGREARE